MKNYNIVALLPLKGKSEKIKGKNFKKFAGKPLFQWTLDSLLGIQNIDLVIINTDAKEILLNNHLQEPERVLIRRRPSHLLGGNVSMNLIVEDDLRAVASKQELDQSL